MNQFIYVVGGFDGTRQLASVERYDTENQTWDSVASIKIARSALSLTVLDGKLYAMGGFDGHSFLNIVEFYDPTQDKWQESTPLTSGRSGHASAVIYQPSCANLYMDCMEDQIDRGKRSNDDDENKPGPSNPGGSSVLKGPSQSTSSSSQLHAFSGGRCTHCDDENKNDVKQEQSMSHAMIRKGKSCIPIQSKYEQDCRDAIHCLSRMDNDDESRNVHSENCNRSYSASINSQMNNDDNCMEISGDEGIPSEYDAIDNPKKFRRKASQYEDNEMGEHMNSIDSCSSNTIIPDLRNRLKAKSNEPGQCSLSKLKNRFRKNISDFVAWSATSVTPPLPQAIPQDSSRSSTIISSNIPSKSASTEERKCDLLRKYYKCKLKS